MVACTMKTKALEHPRAYKPYNVLLTIPQGNHNGINVYLNKSKTQKALSHCTMLIIKNDSL